MHPSVPRVPPNLFFGNDTSRPVQQATDLAKYLPADKRHHYRDGYSMAEAAKCWVAAEGRLPPLVANLIGSDDLEAAHFEYRVTVWGRGLSMTDIMAFIPNGLIAVEAKARENFDDLIAVWIDREKPENARSPAHRLAVVDRYSGAFQVPKELLMDLRYQLLHRTLAAALTAKQQRRAKAWMVVQSFAPSECKQHAENRADFDRYVSVVGPAPVLEGIPVRLAWLDQARD